MVNHAYDSMNIANYLVLLSKKKHHLITNYQLHILLFYVNVKHLVDHEGQILLTENFQQRLFGSIMPSLYNYFQGFGSDIITNTHGKYIFNKNDPFNAKYQPFNENIIEYNNLIKDHAESNYSD